MNHDCVCMRPAEQKCRLSTKQNKIPPCSQIATGRSGGASRPFPSRPRIVYRIYVWRDLASERCRGGRLRRGIKLLGMQDAHGCSLRPGSVPVISACAVRRGEQRRILLAVAAAACRCRDPTIASLNIHACARFTNRCSRVPRQRSTVKLPADEDIILIDHD